MVLTAADLLRLGLTVFLVVLGYSRLANPLRYLLAGRVKQREIPGGPSPGGPVAEGLQKRGFLFLGVRRETLLSLHGRVAAVFAHPEGRLVDLPLSGRVAGAYVMTLFENGRCALTRAGAGRDVVGDRYCSRAVGVGKTLRDLLDTHARSEATVSLGERPLVARTMADRLELGRQWYAEHARTELLVPALLDGVLLSAMLAFCIYIWVL